MGLKIRELRRERDLSMERLAARAGISHATVKRAERTGNATAKTLTKIAAALEVNVGDLFTNGNAA